MEDALLRAVREVIDGPLGEIAPRLSRLLAERWPHRALVIFTRECIGRPRKVAGAAEIVDRLTIAELEELKASVEVGGVFAGTAAVSGAQRRVWAVRDSSDMLLVLVPRGRGAVPAPAELTALFGIAATSIRQQVAQASPDYLAESRAASSERARTIAELTASHEAALAGILATLRAPGLDDARARAAAVDAASAALIASRSRQDTDRARSEELPAAAFQRLRREVEPMLRQRPAAEFVAPAADGRAIPGELASGARAMTHTVVSALLAQAEPGRLRVAWSCAVDALVVDVRDNAGGDVDAAALRRALDGRARTLHADLDVESVPGWGSRATIRLPYQSPATRPDQPLLAQLNPREREVLALVAAGKRNKAIAETLGVAESTVKFHVAAVLRKLAVTSRAEATVIALRANLVPTAAPGPASGQG